jgi:hypothetical protein
MEEKVPTANAAVANDHLHFLIVLYRLIYVLGAFKSLTKLHEVGL